MTKGKYIDSPDYTYMGATKDFEIYWIAESGVRKPTFALVSDVNKVGMANLDSLKKMNLVFTDLVNNVWFSK